MEEAYLGKLVTNHWKENALDASERAVPVLSRGIPRRLFGTTKS